MRDELLSRLRAAIENDPQPGRPLSEAHPLDQAQWVLSELEAFMREHDPPLKITARPNMASITIQDSPAPVIKYNPNEWWDAAPLTPWEG